MVTGLSHRIAVVGPPWVPVPPPAYGGTETVVAGLLRGLRRAGHEVAYAGHPDSTVDAEPLGAIDPSHLGPIGHTLSELAHVLQATDAAEAWGADIVHYHTMLVPGRDELRAPMVITHHGPFDALSTPYFERLGKRGAVVAISAAQAAAAPSVSMAAVVHNGIDVDEWPVGLGDGDYLLFLGRMHPDKGPDRAIEIARQAGVRLILAAKMRETAERAFFEETVEPMLHRGATYIGEADAATKRRLLTGARALLNPIQWPEPFGMVMVEALACGTPVIAMPTGAAPEIVEHGVNGFLCDTADTMVDAIADIDRIDRRHCRASVRQRFSIERMVDGYLDVYGTLVDGGHRSLTAVGD
jgi:glycosyltransferase involved in cell wall biosynthesis